MTTTRFTSKDLEALPDKPGWRYEIIDGELHVSKAAGWEHMVVCAQLTGALVAWNKQTGLGQVGTPAGIIFADDDDVIPDLVWVSHGRVRAILGPDHHFHGPPELVVEVLSPGSGNTRRDKVLKLALYDRRGVDEYWIADWTRKQVEVYRRIEGELRLAATLGEGDTLTSPQLPGFTCPVSSLFTGLPA